MSKSDQDNSSKEVTNQQLNEPAPVPVPADGRIHVHDGLDNSDLRLLQDLAIEQAKRKQS
jgi:hypothetical protein